MSIAVDIVALRKKRLALQREADLLEQQEKGLQVLLIDQMIKDGVKECEGIRLSTTTEPIAESWPDILSYIIETDSVDLLQKRLTPSAVKARWEAGQQVPDIRPETKYSLKFD